MKKEVQYRIKTKEEFENTCEKDKVGNYVCGEMPFLSNAMSKWYGCVLDSRTSNNILIVGKHTVKAFNDSACITKEMITPVLGVDSSKNITPSTNLKVSTFDEKLGKKETENKLNYSEINLDILDLMAKRMNANKHKYPEGNSKRELNVKDLEWALFRHLKKMIKPMEGDEETYKDHLGAILCNASMILDQLELKGG